MIAAHAGVDGTVHGAVVDDAADRTLRLLALATGSYLAVTTVAMIAYTVRSSAPMPLVGHIAALAFACIATFTDPRDGVVTPRRRALRVVRDWLPLALGIFLYVELQWLIEGVGRPHADSAVIGWERQLFPSDPSRTLAPAYPSLALSELLHASYLSYYAMIFVPPALLYARGRRAEFAGTMLALVAAFLICFATFLVFPVEGPRFLVGAAAAPDGPVRSAVLGLLGAASSRGTAFPSAHVAVTVVATACALKYQRAIGLLMVPLALGLMASTVYGGFHYAVDVVAGVVYGAAALLIARLVAGAGAVARNPQGGEALGAPS